MLISRIFSKHCFLPTVPQSSLVALRLFITRRSPFADMGIAVEAMTASDEATVTISEDHSLVLACAWLNLKESCLVASKLFEGSVIRKAGQLMITVLTGTRHKGALEAAASAFAEFCAQLLRKEDFSQLPEEWLHYVLGKWLTTQIESSLT